MNCLYTIPLCNFGFAFRHATCAIVKDFGKALLKTKSSPIFFSYKLSERKPLFEIAQSIIISVTMGNLQAVDLMFITSIYEGKKKDLRGLTYI